MESHQKSSMLLPQSQITTSFGRNTKSSKSVNGDGESIPIDLIIEIFSRLPAKSIARFRCLSKLWASIFRRPDFTELFFTRSSFRPQVFFSFLKDNQVFFYSIPQARNHDEIVSPVVATFVTKTPSRAKFGRFSDGNGLFFLREDCNLYATSGGTELTTVIFNPSTGQSLSLPNLNLKWRSNCFWGYDPVEKQYKILSIFKQRYQILTLGTGNLEWREILCSTEHYPIGNGICIDGVLYYIAEVKNADALSYTMIVSFDIKSEKFNFIKPFENYTEEGKIGTLRNYNGKLAAVKADGTLFVSGRSETLKIWVLEDPKKEEWSKHIHVLPPLWKDVVGKDDLFIVGMIGIDEIVLSSIYDNSKFYLIYYNIKKKSVVKVEIRGMEVSKGIGVYAYLNHVENLVLLS